VLENGDDAPPTPGDTQGRVPSRRQWKREGVEARSLIRSTRGVEGRARALGLGLGRVTNLIHLLETASNQPQNG
jgi:hypothetical protein